MLNNRHFFIAILAPVFELIASSSETSRVVARFIPELANVINSMYMEITSPNIPIPSEPIIFARYMSNTMLIERSIRDTIVNIIVFIKKTFNLFKI